MEEKCRIYYNENDRKAAAWLRELMNEKLIPKGVIDERSIVDVRPDDLAGFVQCHFFAGIGGWAYALRLAGWPETKQVWTASCPCQPFSVGATDTAKGTGDTRDLWPTFFELVRERTPSILFGEQVRNAITWGWWDRAKMDLEEKGYAAASSVLRSDAIGARHQRKRLYWLADSGSKGRKRREPLKCVHGRARAAQSLYGDTVARSGRALDGDWTDLRHSDGVSVAVVRDCIKGFGNAIQPQVAAQFIQAFQEIEGA